MYHLTDVPHDPWVSATPYDLVEIAMEMRQAIAPFIATRRRAGQEAWTWPW